MRSEIIKRIIEATPPEVDRFVDLYAKVVVAKGNLERHINSLENINTGIGFASGLKEGLRQIELILK